MASVSLLKESELFKGLRQEVIEKIAAICQDTEQPRGTTIFSERSEAQYLYVLEHGLVTLRIDAPAGEDKVMVAAIRDKGEIFGWSALVEPHIYTSTAICLEPSRLTAVDGAKLLQVLDEDPQSGFAIMRKLAALVASRLRKTQTALTSALKPGLISHG